MLNRYLGNKTDLLDPIMSVIDESCAPGDLVCDIFSGTLAVSFELKRRGYRVASNDINLFSYVYGKAFLVNREVPSIELRTFIPKAEVRNWQSLAVDVVTDLRGNTGFTFLENPLPREKFEQLIALLLFLYQADEALLPADYRKTHIFDTYTEEGANSAFTSLRGTTGRRRFFSGSNGRRIDRILNHLRYWRQSGMLVDPLYSILLCVLLDSVEKVSNTQGTYHDFPRDKYDSRALKPIIFQPPPFDDVISDVDGHLIGQEQDSLEFIVDVPKHAALYIDPPYNFRQYTAYYFMPNVLCRYCDLADTDDYFARVQFVRGQNMDDDFVSPFCKPAEFLGALEKLIDGADTDLVVLSYFDGRNHWNNFKEECNGIGYARLQDFFRSNQFAPESLRVVPVERLNYQSYGGYKARMIQEFLFVANKR